MSRLRAENGCFYLDGKPFYLLAGEFQYFRVPKGLWASSLAVLKQAGLNTISTYIPWAWHHYEEEASDFTGKTHPQRDLVGFIEACKARDLLLIVRPGPFIYAEYQGLGHPEWLGRKYPNTVVLKPDGKQDKGEFWANYSLHHPIYQRFVRLWYQKVIRALKPYFNQPVIAFQIDNETGLMYANKVGVIDFNPETIKQFIQFVEKTYKQISTLNQCWQTNYASFEKVLPPKGLFKQPQAVDWQIFLEYWICQYLGWLKEAARTFGVNVPIIHNEQAIHHSPSHVSQKRQKVDFLGYSLYLKETHNDYTCDFPFGNAIYPAIFSSLGDKNRPLFSLETGLGWFDPRSKVSDEAGLQNIFGPIAHGVKGHCFYPAHDGLQIHDGLQTHDGLQANGSVYSYPGILDKDGSPTSRYSLVEKAAYFIKTYQAELLTSEEVYDSIGYAYYYPNFRFLPQEYLPGQKIIDPIKYLSFLGHFGLYSLLLTCGYNPRMIDLENANLEELSQYKILIFPNKGYIQEEVYQRLREYCRQGGSLITLPFVPRANLHGQRLDTKELYPAKELRERWLDRRRLYSFLGLNWLINFGLFERKRLKELHPTCMHIIDLSEPLLVAMQAPLEGQKLSSSWGSAIKGDFLVKTFEALGHSLLRDRVKTVGYQVEVGEGTSTVLGTPLGASYVTSRYYATLTEERTLLAQFASKLITGLGVAKRFDTDLEAEAIFRKVKGGGYLLFIINRLGFQRGKITFKDMTLSQVDILFSFKNSSVQRLSENQIFVALAADDCLVLKLCNYSGV